MTTGTTLPTGFRLGELKTVWRPTYAEIDGGWRATYNYETVTQRRPRLWINGPGRTEMKTPRACRRLRCGDRRMVQ